MLADKYVPSTTGSRAKTVRPTSSKAIRFNEERQDRHRRAQRRPTARAPEQGPGKEIKEDGTYKKINDKYFPFSIE
jgi:hypothetical protein